MGVNLLFETKLNSADFDRALACITTAQGTRNWLGQYEVSIDGECLSETRFVEAAMNLYRQICSSNDGDAIDYESSIIRGRELLKTVEAIQDQRVETRENLFFIYRFALWFLDTICCLTEPAPIEAAERMLHLLFCDLTVDPFSNKVFTATREILALPADNPLRIEFLKVYRHITRELGNVTLPEDDPVPSENPFMPMGIQFIPFSRLENARQTLIALATNQEMVKQYPVLASFDAYKP